MSRYQNGKTNLDFAEARDSEWQWHQLGHMQVCTSLRTDNHASTPPLRFYRPDALPAANQQCQSTEGQPCTLPTGVKVAPVLTGSTWLTAAASSMAGSGDLLSFPASTSLSSSGGGAGGAGGSRLRLPHVVGYYETDARKPFPKDSKKWNVSVDQLKAAIVRLAATHSGTAGALAPDGIPASWAAFAQHVAAIKEQAPNTPAISYDEVTATRTRRIRSRLQSPVWARGALWNKPTSFPGRVL